MAGADSVSSATGVLNHATAAHASPERLALVVETVREISRQHDPQTMVALFRDRAGQIFGGGESMSLSRRGLHRPHYRITRSTRWSEHINPWTQPERLPLLKGGLIAELIYGDEPKILSDVCVSTEDPAYPYLKDARSLVCLPLYDNGAALNMVLRISDEPDGFDGISLADAVLQSNLFGRATHNLLVAQELRSAYAELDRELKRVGEIQRSLLPARLPNIEGLDIAASYKIAARAGGDYYDFFDLGDGRWGVVIADVSGHGTPAAVVMAILRTILHAQCYECVTPAEMLSSANKQLYDQSAKYDGTFVTAFYGIYDPTDRSLRYSAAGHNPPLLVDREIRVRELDGARSLPLAVTPDCVYDESEVSLERGDTLLLYTDGITEATNDADEFYGRERLLSCVREDVPNAQHIIDCVVHKLIGYTGGKAQVDDQTLLALRVT